MSKKKIISLCLVVCLLATAIGGTLAYFTDNEGATNEFTMGNVVIDLVEEQRDGDGGLEEFTNDKVLMPVAENLNWQSDFEKVDGINLPTAANWVDKIVTVDNEGNQPAYVRVLFAFPQDMDDETSGDNMMMRWMYDAGETAGTWTRVDTGVDVTIGKVVYNVYSCTYQAPLAAGATTASPAITGVYLNANVECVANPDGSFTYLLGDKSVTYAKGEGPKLYVVAVGVQAAGFEEKGADAALEAGFGSIKENAQDWFDLIGDDMRADK